MKLEELKRNPFDAPIPGQSLAGTPGDKPWERPPQYTSVPDAMEYLHRQLMRPTKYKPLIAMLKKDKVPLEAIARTILLKGFQEGKWTYDMVVLMAKPLLMLLAAFASMLDIDTQIEMPYHAKDAKKHEDEAIMSQVRANPVEAPEDRSKGFMIPPAKGEVE